ncbi:hypothetical protein CYMTET_19984 [Cymbomonas tetramitiformis]|uniref:Sfi1 spindle body domain-containing protein n=1 Tax=Cymbomonas tetramitiformis TaxID=36881 RepID=A0AAE0L4M5_9CHLO|nr:hypothetical protein CYMTET_19984 [Cymbomonas tetramitiformis]
MAQDVMGPAHTLMPGGQRSGSRRAGPHTLPRGATVQWLKTCWALRNDASPFAATHVTLRKQAAACTASLGASTESEGCTPSETYLRKLFRNAMSGWLQLVGFLDSERKDLLKEHFLRCDARLLVQAFIGWAEVTTENEMLRSDFHTYCQPMRRMLVLMPVLRTWQLNVRFINNVRHYAKTWREYRRPFVELEPSFSVETEDAETQTDSEPTIADDERRLEELKQRVASSTSKKEKKKRRSSTFKPGPTPSSPKELMDLMEDAPYVEEEQWESDELDDGEDAEDGAEGGPEEEEGGSMDPEVMLQTMKEMEQIIKDQASRQAEQAMKIEQQFHEQRRSMICIAEDSKRAHRENIMARTLQRMRNRLMLMMFEAWDGYSHGMYVQRKRLEHYVNLISDRNLKSRWNAWEDFLRYEKSKRQFIQANRRKNLRRWLARNFIQWAEVTFSDLAKSARRMMQVKKKLQQIRKRLVLNFWLGIISVAKQMRTVGRRIHRRKLRLITKEWYAVMLEEKRENMLRAMQATLRKMLDAWRMRSANGKPQRLHMLQYSKRCCFRKWSGAVKQRRARQQKHAAILVKLTGYSMRRSFQMLVDYLQSKATSRLLHDARVAQMHGRLHDRRLRRSFLFWRELFGLMMKRHAEERRAVTHRKKLLRCKALSALQHHKSKRVRRKWQVAYIGTRMAWRMTKASMQHWMVYHKVLKTRKFKAQKMKIFLRRRRLDLFLTAWSHLSRTITLRSYRRALTREPTPSSPFRPAASRSRISSIAEIRASREEVLGTLSTVRKSTPLWIRLSILLKKIQRFIRKKRCILWVGQHQFKAPDGLAAHRSYERSIHVSSAVARGGKDLSS